MKPIQPPGVVSAFGKVPAAGDFLRSNANGEPVATFEAWLTEGLATADERLGQRFQQAFLNGPVQAFLYRAPSVPSRVLAGVIRPNRDAVGRRFPMVVCAALDANVVAGAPHLLPLVLGDFLEAATSTASSVDHVRSQAELESWLQRIPALRVDGLEAAHWEYVNWLQTTPVTTAWSAIYGAAASAASVKAIHTIEQCVAGFRGQDNPNTPLAMRAPLGGGGPAAAAFWIDVVRTTARWRATVPNCFWSFDGHAGSILLHFGDVSLRTVAELWVPDEDSDHVCDLTTASSVDPSRFLSGLPRGVAEVVNRPDASVGHLVSALAQ